jgi:enoyl-CoA hydratase/carnithine racemase
LSYSQIVATNEGPIARLILNRPEKLNAWTNVMEGELREAIHAAEADDRIRAIVITGAGRGFCAGADMSALTHLSGGASYQSVDAGAVKAESDANFTQKFSYLLHVTKPIFCAINGPIAGIGLCMALFCDFRYMAASARLTTAFARRGLIAEHGMSWILPRLVGLQNAADLLFSGRLVEAREAGEMGLVRVLPDEAFLLQVERIADEMTKSSSPRSIRIMKRMVYDAQFQDLAGAWAVADKEMLACFGTEDFKEGVAHFLEKRPARFTGR